MEFRFEDALPVLQRTPAALRELLQDLPDSWTKAVEGPDTWSPFDIVGHLIHGERTDWIPRARIILDHGESRPFDRFNRSAQFEESKGKTLAELLDEFAMERRRSLNQLAAMRLTGEDVNEKRRNLP